jgi:hypothetical protein
MFEWWNGGLEIRRRFEVKVKKGELMFECSNVGMLEWWNVWMLVEKV